MSATAAEPAGSRHVSATVERTLRIGELAELTGTTPRTIRYYEEIGLLGGGSRAHAGQAPLLHEADVERVKEIVRLRDLLGLSLEQLSQLLEAETARAELRREYQQTESPADAQADPRAARCGTSARSSTSSAAACRSSTELAAELEEKQKLVKRRIRENS